MCKKPFLGSKREKTNIAVSVYEVEDSLVFFNGGMSRAHCHANYDDTLQKKLKNKSEKAIGTVKFLRWWKSTESIAHLEVLKSDRLQLI